MGLYRLAWNPMAVAYGIHVSRPNEYSATRGANPNLGFDRDLSLAGRAMVKMENGDYVQKLVKIDRPSMTCCQMHAR